MGNKRQQKLIKPPELPPEKTEDEVEVSDEDLDFVSQNRAYAAFVSQIDTTSIDKYVSRIADARDDEVEALYEKRLRKQKKEAEKNGDEVDPVEALPVKTLDGELYYRRLLKKLGEEGQGGGSEAAATADDDVGVDKSVVRLNKAERRAKLKREKKEAKKQQKKSGRIEEEVQQAPQASVLAEVKEDLTAEEAFESKKVKLAELGIALLADPEANIKSLKEMLHVCRDDNHNIVKLGLLSLSAVFKDIIPGYRIRLPTEKELEMKVSKEVKKMRFYESTLLSAYKAYLQRLMALDKDSKYQHVVVRCFCTLLEAVPHFNFCENLLGAVVKNAGSPDDFIRKLCCATIRSLFTNEGKHGGEATVEAVRLIADHVKANNCQLHPDCVEVFMALSFDEDLAKPREPEKDSKTKYKKNKKRKNVEEPKPQKNDRKRSKKELMTQMREEVAAEYKSVAFAPDVEEQRRMQSETLSAVFETYFRILKHTLLSTTASLEENGNVEAGASGPQPLLAPCLNGLAKFSHLIDLDYIGDLMSYLKRLAGGSTTTDGQKSLKSLTVSECLQCCIVAFKVMRSNLDALNVDLQGFFVQLYNLILEYRPGRDKGEVLAEALKIMLCEDRQHDMQKAAAFVKRLATFSLCFGSAESMAALVTLKHLLQKNVKCRNLLENDAGGGSVAGFIAKYQPYASDPNLSGALASVLWELNLLSKHYHPSVSTITSGISTMSSAHNQVYLTSISPQQAYMDLLLERESFNQKNDNRKSSNKRKRVSGSSNLQSIESTIDTHLANEDELRKKFADHFAVLHEFKEDQRLRRELERANLALQLYEEYKMQKKSKVQSSLKE